MSGLNWSNPPASNYQRGPRHGRADSQPGFQMLFSDVISEKSIRSVPHSPPRTYQPTPTVNRDPRIAPNDLQRWSAEHLTPFLRWAYTVRDNNGNARANYNYDADINNAINLSETIDAFDANPQLAGELVLRISNPDLGHSSMDWIVNNRSLVELLLYRHYKRHGGLMLPPRQDAVIAMQAHERAIVMVRQTDARLRPEMWPRVVFPYWRETGSRTLQIDRQDSRNTDT